MPFPTFVEKVLADGGKGVQINPIKKYVRPFWTFAANATIAGNGETTLRFPIDSQGHFEWCYILGRQTGVTADIIVEFTDEQANRRLQNGMIRSLNVFGSGMRPFRLPKPYWLDVGDSAREITCRVQNPNAGQVTIQLILYGRRFLHKEMPPELNRQLVQEKNKGFKAYSYFMAPLEQLRDRVPTALAINGTATLTFEADDNADFLLHKWSFISTGAFSYVVRERATNRILSNGVVGDTTAGGNGEFNAYFADTYLLERKKQLLWEFTNLAAGQNTIIPTLSGVRMQFR